MAHTLGLGSFCFVVWLLLSGHFDALLLACGLLSCVLVVWIARRMDVVDREGFPLHLSGRALVYWPWLLVQIVRANLAVARIVLDPALPVSPTLLRLRCSQRTDLGRAVYANSITLTPGTVCTAVQGDELEVHALTRAGAEHLRRGGMDRRVSRLERG